MIYAVLTLILGLISYPISRYLMHKGMTLDLTMPGNNKRYKWLGRLFIIPYLNMVTMFLYLCYTIHKFERR